MDYVYIWEFEINEACREQFLHSYGPDGEWVALFRQAPGYVGTTLMSDTEHPLRFLTLDRWRSREAQQEFAADYRDEYACIDSQCEAFTVREACVGHFWAPAAAAL